MKKSRIMSMSINMLSHEGLSSMSTKHESRDRFSCSMKHVRRLIAAIVIALLSPLASAQVGLLQSGSNLIQSVDTQPVVGILTSIALAEVTLTGSGMDDKGSGAVALTGGLAGSGHGPGSNTTLAPGAFSPVHLVDHIFDLGRIPAAGTLASRPPNSFTPLNGPPAKRAIQGAYPPTSGTTGYNTSGKVRAKCYGTAIE
jgi:hypothetical protein